MNHNQRQAILASLRAVVPKRRLRAYELRQISELQASRLRRHLGDPFDPFFDDTKLADLPRIRLEAEPDLPASGMSIWDGHSWVLAVNSSEALARQRFSLLHEFHHVVTHGLQDHLFGSSRGDDSSRSARAERAADYFAACVLMPKLLVKRHWGQGPRQIKTMADLFGVSPQAMTFRLQDLGLLEDRRRCSWVREARTND